MGKFQQIQKGFERNVKNGMSSETETTFHYCWRVKSSFTMILMESTSPVQFADWLLVEEALLVIGLTKISFVKNWFGPPSRKG